MLSLKNIFNSKKGEKTEKVKEEIRTYIDELLSGWDYTNAIEMATAKFKNHIYKRNGKYRDGGKELRDYIISLSPLRYYYN